MTLKFNDGFNIQSGGSGGGTPADAYTKEETDTLLAGKADTSLDNLTAEGEAAINSVASDKDLANLSSVGENRLHALKGYEDAGELLTDAEGLADVTKYAHSTFDASKFSVIGAPIINDGIASGFSSNNWLFLSNVLLTETGHTYKFKGATSISTASLSLSEYVFSFYVNRVAGEAVWGLFFRNTGKLAIVTSNGTTNTVYDSNFVFSADTMYNYEFETDLNTFVKLYINEELVLSQALEYSDIYPYSGDIQIGAYVHNKSLPLQHGQIDLKQFSITADGVEVFSGNKTGLDTIKPDNYTVVGTPMISADGMLDKSVYATQQDALGNYLSHYIGDIPTTSTIRIKCKFTVKKLQGVINNDGGGIYGLKNVSATAGICVPLIEPGTTMITIWGEITGGIRNFYNCTIGSTYYIETIDTFTQKIINIYDANDNLLKTGTYNRTSAISANWENITLYISQSNATNQGNNSCSFDLNEFKVWIDGNLVYQPCLKIPYTLSKTGSKIVDSQYRDRVSDMYEQYGYAPYYTLSDMDFTLPMGELYGMIERKMPNVSAIIAITQTDYDNLGVKDPNTLYVIVGE